MEKKDFFEENIKNLIFSHGEELKMDEEQKKKIIEQLITKSTDGQIKESHFYNFRKLAIAAAIVLVPAVLAVYLLLSSSQKIKIPPELALMSVEQLIKLNYDTSQSTFDPNIVKYALKHALDKSSPQEVIKIAKSQKKGGGMSADMAYPPAHPLGDSVGHPVKAFPEVVEESNLFIHAKLLDFNLNVEDIINALVEKEKLEFLEDFMSRYKVTIKFFIIDCLPNNRLKKGNTITIPTILYEDQLNAIKKNSDYYLAMVQHNNEPKLLEHISGFYPVDFNKPENIEVWQFFKDTQDILLFGQTPKSETIDYWISKLNGDTFALALEYMDILPDELLPSVSLMDAVESKYENYTLKADEILSRVTNREIIEELDLAEREVDSLKRGSIEIFNKAMNLIIRSKDKESIKRMLSLVEEDTSSTEKSILMERNNFNRGILPLILRLIIAAEENNISEKLIDTYIKYKSKPLVEQNLSKEIIKRFYGNESLQRSMKTIYEHNLANEIVNQAIKLPIKDIELFLLKILEDSSVFGLYDNATFRKLWSALSLSDSYDIRSYLEDFLSEPNLADINVYPPADKNYNEYSLSAFEEAAFDVLQSLPDNKRPERKELLHYLLRIYERNGGGSRYYINKKLKTILRPEDNEILPVLESFLSMDYKPNTANGTEDIIIDIMHDPSLVPFIKAAIDKIPNKSDTISLIEALYACGEKEDAVKRAFELLDQPLRQDKAYNLFLDIYRNSKLLLFLGRTNIDYIIPYIEEYAKSEYSEKYANAFAGFNDILVDSSKSELKQNAIMALTRLAGKDAIPKLREVYKTTDDIRAKVTCAFGLYYNGDKTGEKLLRHLVEGTLLNVPEIQRRWRLDLSEGDLFQNIISSYLRNELTDALWLEKLTYYVDRADTDIESDFFKEHKREILDIMVNQLDNKNRETRGYACEILQKATGQNFGFDSGRYAGQQEDIIQRWREYLKSEQE